MGVLGRRGATCIFNPYHPTPEAVETGYGNGITDLSNGLDLTLLKWGLLYTPQTSKYPIYSWWVNDNESSGKTDGAWFPQGPGNRISKKKGGGYLFLNFGLEVTGYGHIYGGYYNLYGGNNINGYDRVYYLGSHIPYTKNPGIFDPVNAPFNPPFPAGTEFISTRSAEYTTLYYRPPDPTEPFEQWRFVRQSLAVDGVITTEVTYENKPRYWNPLPEGWKLWWEEDGKKHYWKETGGDIDSEYLNENFVNYSSPYYYHNEQGLIPRDDEADNYPEYDISSTDLTDPESTQYGIFESENSLNIYNTYKFLCWNTPVSDYCWRKDYKTMNFKLVVQRNSQGCDTGCSYAGKKFNFKLTYQEGDMEIALNGSNTWNGTPFYATKSTITWGEIKTENITVDPLKLSDWTAGPISNQKEVWTKNWSAEEIGRGKARRLIDFYLESIED
jgi:hypothetical protein